MPKKINMSNFGLNLGQTAEDSEMFTSNWLSSKLGRLVRKLSLNFHQFVVTFDIVYKHYYSVALQAWVLPKNIRRKIENTSINGDIDHAADLPKTKNGDTNTGKATVVC